MHHGTRIALYAQPKELPHRSRVLRKIELHAAIVRAHLEAQAEQEEGF